MKEERTMKCCGCGKAIDLNEGTKNGMSQWYGIYTGCTIIKVICHPCIKDPEKKVRYSENDK